MAGKYLKKLRQYRIPIKTSDNVIVDIVSESKSLSSLNVDIELVNISSSGVGVYIPSHHILDEVFDVELRFQKLYLTGRAHVVRRTKEETREFDDYVGVEFVEVDVFLLQNFIHDIVSNMSSRRLKKLMVDMIENEGRAVINENEDLEVSAYILTELFHAFEKYNNSYSLMFLFAQEVKRTINAEKFRFYMFEHDGKDVSIFDFEEGKPSSSVLPISGHIKDVKDTGKIIRSRLSKKNVDDQFYSLLQTLFDVNIDTFILAPVIDKSGMTVGVIEFSNKSNHELFNEKDLYEVSLLSTIIGLNFSLHNDTENFEYAKKLQEFYDAGHLIGTSEESRYLNSFIDTTSLTEDNVFISGEYGVGKKLIAVNMHNKSPRSIHGIGHVNCHDIETEKDLTRVLSSDGEHTGILDFYSGGTIVFKDINFLSVELQEKLYNELVLRDDIRFMATSTQTLETLERDVGHDVIYRPLISFLSTKSVRVPALRERKEDIIPLTHFFAYQLCQSSDLAPKNISAEVLNHFSNYDWPGNISELRIALDRLIILGRDLKTLVYKRTRVLPLLDREIDHDFTIGLDLNHDFLDQSDAISSGDFEELYFYFYVEELVGMKHYEFFELAEHFDMEYDQFYERLFHAHDKALTYFGVNSELVSIYLEDKAAAA